MKCLKTGKDTSREICFLCKRNCRRSALEHEELAEEFYQEQIRDSIAKMEKEKTWWAGQLEHCEKKDSNRGIIQAKAMLDAIDKVIGYLKE